MKTIMTTRVLFVVSSLLIGCEDDFTDVKLTELNNTLNESTTEPIKVVENDSSYDWKMEIISVTNFIGNEQDEVFKNILLGQPIPSDIFTTNTTYFKFKEDSNKIELKLDHYGWTIWEANGFYPIEWEFTYSLANNKLEIEGLANIALSDCYSTENIKVLNRFYFEGLIDESWTLSTKYKGTYIWTESLETKVCIRIEGEMNVIKIMD